MTSEPARLLYHISLTMTMKHSARSPESVLFGLAIITHNIYQAFKHVIQDLGILPMYKELSSLAAVSVLHVYHVVMTIASSKS